MQRPKSELRYEPLGHNMQAEIAAEEGGDDWPTGHFWHVADVFAPMTEEYVDAGQD